jgi:predicted flap endonuclease-1-like 5' DNA nuclease
LAEVDETLTFKVIEFNRDDKRIMVSHLRYLEDIQREAEDVVKDERKKEGKEITKAVKEQQSKYEPTTLGDMAMFSQLKEQLADAKEAKGKADAEAKEEAAVVAEAPVAVEVPAAVEEAPVVAEEAIVAEEPKAKAVKAKSTGDDLKIIEGIGPKIEEILQEAGVDSFAALAAKSADEVREILLAQGSRYKMHDPETWAEQAQLAADGKMDELEALKKELNAGKKE